MGQQNNVKQNGKFFYVEPNIDGPVNLEDLSVYAELRVSFNQTKTVKENDYILQMKISKDGGNNLVSLYSGANDYDGDGDKNIFLTTSSYSNYTYKDIVGSNPTSELFGVETIDVSYNSFVVPEVTIKFTDIKGAALHAAEEYVLSESLNNNMTESSKFLSCFFTVPYPRFELYLKGFYGKPVFYDLSCASFKTEFHADTGNYSAVATLVGYSFSLLSDITMCSLIAAPLSTYAGKDYWTQSSFKFDDGIAMPTFQELIVKWKGRQHQLKKIIVTEKENLDTLKAKSEASEGISNYLDDLSDSPYFTDGHSDCIGSFDKNHHKITFNTEDGGVIDNLLTTIDLIIKDKDDSVEFSFKGKYDKEKKEVDFSELVKTLQSNVDEYNEQNINYDKAVKEKLDDALINVLGFTPTVSNITKMCFAHLETLLYMFEQVKNSKPNNLEKIFPRYLAKDTQNNVTKIVETWSGAAGHGDDAETLMVRGLVSGIKIGQSEEQKAVEENQRKEDENETAVIVGSNGETLDETTINNKIKNGRYYYPSNKFSTETLEKLEDLFLVYARACPLKEQYKDAEYAKILGMYLADVVFNGHKTNKSIDFKRVWKSSFHKTNFTKEKYQEYLTKKYNRNTDYSVFINNKANGGVEINNVEHLKLHLLVKDFNTIMNNNHIQSFMNVLDDGDYKKAWLEMLKKMTIDSDFGVGQITLTNYMYNKLENSTYVAVTLPKYITAPYYGYDNMDWCDVKDIKDIIDKIQKSIINQSLGYVECGGVYFYLESSHDAFKSNKGYELYSVAANVDVNIVQFETYIDSFQTHYNTLLNQNSSDVGGMINQVVTTSTSSEIPDYLELNIYRYLKQLWDRWVLNGYYGVEEWKMKNVFDGPTKRVHLIDSSFNELGDSVVADGVKLLELLESCKQQTDLQMLSFLSKFYADNNCSLHNVQNFMEMRTSEGVSQIFEAINHKKMQINEAKRYSDLVVLFSYQAASSQEDSFNIDDEVLPSQYTAGNVGGNIPSFGIAFGMQNQNYFMDVGVSMNTPNTTDQSIQALFQIVDSQLTVADSETEIKVGNIGSNLYRVYANHAYQCTIKMMGCAWIQPLMYFQLMNIPLFRGAYIIHKVTHSMTPNNMITTFVGTKVSSRGMKALDGGDVVSLGGSETITVTQKDVATVSNDCTYPYRSPVISGDLSNGEYKEFLKEMLKLFESNMDDTYVPKKIGPFISKMFNLAPTKKETDKYKLIFVFCNACLSKMGEIKSWGKDDWYRQVLNILHNLDIWQPIVDNDKEGGLYTKLKECFNNPISFLISEENGFSGEEMQKYISFDSIEKANAKPNNENGGIIECNDGTYFIISSTGGKNYYNLNNKTNVATNPIDNVLDSIKYSVKETKIVSGVTVTCKENKKGYYILTVDKTENFDVIFDIIVQNYSDYFSFIGWKIKDNNNNELSEIIVQLKDSTTIKKTENTDLRIVVCNENYEPITDSCDNFHSSFCMSIIKKYKFKRKDGKYDSIDNEKFKTECPNFFKLINKEDTWQTDIINFFNKHYSNIIIEDCTDVISKMIKTMQASQQGFARMVKPPDYDGEQWHGLGPNQDPKCDYRYESVRQLLLYKNSEYVSKSLNDGQGLTIDGTAQARMAYVAEKLDDALEANNTESNSQCAGPPRQMMGTKGYGGRTGLGIKVYDNSNPNCGTEDNPVVPSIACRYWQISNWIGMNMIAQGRGQSNEEFEALICGGKLQNGDISITAGLERPLKECIDDGRGDGDSACKDWYGHIQIYYGDSKKNKDRKWLSDCRLKSVRPYPKPRTTIILRGGTLRPTYAGSNNDLFKPIQIEDMDNYFPSCYFFYMLFGFEGITSGWFRDPVLGQPGVYQHAIGLGCSFNAQARENNELYKELYKYHQYDRNNVPVKPSGYCENNTDFTSYTEEKTLSIEGVLHILYAMKFYDSWLVPLREEMKAVANAGQTYNRIQWDAIMENAWAGQVYVTSKSDGSPSLFNALKIGDTEKAKEQLNVGITQGLAKRRGFTKQLFEAGTQGKQELLDEFSTDLFNKMGNDIKNKYETAVKKLRTRESVHGKFPYHLESDSSRDSSGDEIINTVCSAHSNVTKILIDAGHGQGNANGSPYEPDGSRKIVEWKYNRLIAKNIVKFLTIELKKLGTKYKDDSVELIVDDTDKDLNARWRYVNKVCTGQKEASNVILISVHCNGDGDKGQWEDKRGWLAITYPGGAKAGDKEKVKQSDELATALRKYAITYFDDQEVLPNEKRDNLAMVKYPQCAAVLTENFYTDNKFDAAYMLKKETQINIVKVHVSAILEYITGEKITNIDIKKEDFIDIQVGQK